MNFRFILAIVIIYVSSINVFSQAINTQFDDSTKYRIGITSGSFIPDKAIQESFQTESLDKFNNKYFKVIQFYQIPSDQERLDWANQGLVLTDYLPGNAYYAVIDAGFNLTSIQNYIRAFLPVSNLFKMESALYFNGISDNLTSESGKAKITVSYYASLSPSEVIADFELKGYVIEEHRKDSRQFDVMINISDLTNIVQIPYIQFVGLKEDPILEGEDHNNSTGRSNFLNTGFNGLNFNGNGVVIGIGEGGTVGTLIDGWGRLNEMVTGSPSSHKIGVMRYAAGAGNTDPSNRNNAMGATLLSVPGSPDYSALYTSHNLRYTNHSYGWSVAGGYDQTARDHDLRIATHPLHLVIYSAGNSGTSTGFAPYSFAGWSNITGMPKQNKNHFAIGALNPSDQLTGFSSRGPMYDGRVIPQVAIEGSGGTSNAAPKVTGLLAILNQIYKSKNGGAESPSSLLRAILMNSADDMDNPGPDYRSGYGRPNMRRAYSIINNNQILTGSVSTGNSNAHQIVVPPNTKQVRVMIGWPDVAASVNANPALVNNLNLVATAPNATTFNPWILNHVPSVANISAPATRGVDNLNNIEQVTVDNPVSGNWTFNVSGANVPFGPQSYHLNYEFLMDELHMAFPLENHKFISGDTYFLRWDSYGSTSPFNLSYELNNDGNWINITTGFDANSRVFTWLAPFVSGGINTIRFRVQRDSQTSTSGVNQIGAVPVGFRVFSVCNNDVTLKWSPVLGATGYKVYKLGAQNMEEVTSGITFNGNSATLTGQSSTASEYYSMSAVTGSNEGPRTLAIEKIPGNFMCGGKSWTGILSSDWFTAGNWSPSSIPLSSEHVIIPAAPFNQPLIAATGAVAGRILIESGASLTMSSTTAFTLSISDDWINNGTFNRGIGTVDFIGTGNYQEIGGSSTSAFNILKVTKGAQSRILEATSLITLNGATNPMNLTSGTFRLSSPSTITPFTNSSGANLTSAKGLWNNGGIINTGNFSFNIDAGLLRVSAGIVNIGTTSGNTITYLNNGRLIMEGGSLNIAGGFSPNSNTSSGTFTQTGGIITLNTAGSTSTTRAPFEINPGVTFTMTGGTLIIRRASSNSVDYLNQSTTNNVTGGVIQIGDASTPAGQIIRINSTVPIYHLLVNSTNSPTAQIITNSLTVKNNITISGGILNSNGQNITLGGEWINNGNYTHNNSTVTFNGITEQNIGGSSSTTFNNLIIDGLDVKFRTTAIPSQTIINGDITINTGKLLTVPLGQTVITN
jgi:hypothetical protein